jgi:hypothetical protein
MWDLGLKVLETLIETIAVVGVSGAVVGWIILFVIWRMKC